MSEQVRFDLKRRGLLLGVVALGLAAAAAEARSSDQMTVYKSPTCGCCTAWVDHARRAGFTPAVVDTDDLGSVKAKFGVPPALASCHTVVVGGHVFEGHVPIADIRRFLAQPHGLGLSVPGMPLGSPGMEAPDGRVEPFTVQAFDRQGRTWAFAGHGA